MALTELFKLRCPLADCRKVVIPSGTAMGGAISAGDLKVFNNILCFAVDDVPVDDSNDSTKASTWITYAPVVEVARNTGDSAWSVGAKVYYDSTNGYFTTTGTNLAEVGYVREAAATDAETGIICFMGDDLGTTPDVDSAA